VSERLEVLNKDPVQWGYLTMNVKIRNFKICIEWNVVGKGKVVPVLNYE
jgi:hypothetical protein